MGGEKSMNENVKRRIKLQEEYCKRTMKTPQYAPSDGICWRCGRQIYEEYGDEYASNNLVTGCPYCHMSYVE